MAITKILYINSSPRGATTTHLVNSIDYILNPKKTKNGLLTGSLNCDKDNAFQDMMDTKEFYGKTDLRQGYHIMISFSPGETDEETAMDILHRFAEKFIGEKYECVYAVHNDKNHMHGHLVFNSVSCQNGKKYHYANGDWKREIQPITNSLCEEYGLEIINLNEKGLQKYDNYGEWYGDKKGFLPLNMEQIKADMDEAVIASVNMDEFIEYLKLKDYDVKLGKHMTIKAPDRERGIRTYRLGYAYTPEGLEKRLAGEEYNLDTYSVDEIEERSKMKRVGYHAKGLHGVNSKNQYYQYQDDVRHLQKMQRQNTYLSKYNIQTSTDLRNRVERLTLLEMQFSQERINIFGERKKHKEAIRILNSSSMTDLEKNASLLQQGYNPEKIRLFEKESKLKLEELRKRKRSCTFELRMCEEIRQTELRRTR